MRLRSLAILAAMAAVLTLHVALFERERVAPWVNVGRKFPDLEAADIVEIEVARRAEAAAGDGGGTVRSIVLRREGEPRSWWIVSPIRFEAFHPRAQAMAFEIADMARVARVEPGAEVFPAVPEMTVSFQTRTGGKETIEFGPDHPDPELDFAYCRVGSDAFVTRKEIRKTFMGSLAELRSRALFPIPRTEAALVAVAGDSRSTKTIERVGDAWRLRKPLDAVADRQETEDLLDDLNAWTAAEFVKDDAARSEDLAPFGLDPPRLTVTVRHARDRAVTLEIGAEREQGGRSLVYARHAGEPFVFLADAAPLERLLKPPEEFRSPLLLDLGVDLIEDLGLRTGDARTSIRIARLAVGGTKPPEGKAVVERDYVWRVTDLMKGESFPGDDRLIESLTGSLGNTLIEKFVDAGTPLSAVGLDPPRVIVTLKTGGVSTEVLIGEPSSAPEDRGRDVYHAARPGEPGSYLVRTELPRLLAEGAHAFRQRGLSLLEPARALAIEVHAGDKKWALMRLAEEPWTLSTETPLRSGAAIDQTKVNALLATLHHDRFRALRFLPELTDYAANEISLSAPRRAVRLVHVMDKPSALFEKLVLGRPAGGEEKSGDEEEVLARVDLPDTPPFTVGAELSRLFDELAVHLREITEG